jgi:ubiquinone/menaquinone biosynthesis C-methylase UbiE
MRHQLDACSRAPSGDRRVTDRVERRAALQALRAASLAAQVEELLTLTGEERALDVGAGAGALAFALAPHVRTVTAVEIDEELAERAREAAPENVQVVVGDGEHLALDSFSFDFAGTLRTLHHTHRPELLVAELVRVTRPGGTILVVDQLAPTDPLAALELTRFEQARDPSTSRLLADADLRGLFDSNSLVLRREVVTREPRDLDAYLDLAGCEGDERDRVLALAPTGYEAVTGWYVLTRP